MIKVVPALLLGILAGSQAQAAGETLPSFGLSPGTSPNTVCIFDLSATRPCVQIATLDSTAHTFSSAIFAAALSGPRVISGGGTIPANQIIYEDSTVTGSSTDLLQGINQFTFRDQVTAGTNGLIGLYINHHFRGGTGGRYAFDAGFAMDTSPDPSDPSSQFYAGGNVTASASVPAKTGLTGGGTYCGTCYAGNSIGLAAQSSLTSGATFWGLLEGTEFAVSIYTGASAADRFGINVISGGDLQANNDDAGIGVSMTPTGPPFKFGIEFGGIRRNAPFNSSSTIIGVTPRSQGGVTTPAALNGIDFSSVTFAGSAFKSPGFGVDGNGNIVGNLIKTVGFTVSGLPAAGTAGRRAYVTDQLTSCPAVGAALTGGGAVKCPVFDNGTAWVSG